MVLPVIVASKMEACGGRRSRRKGWSVAAFLCCLVLLVVEEEAGGHGEFTWAEVELKVMRGEASGVMVDGSCGWSCN